MRVDGPLVVLHGQAELLAAGVEEGGEADRVDQVAGAGGGGDVRDAELLRDQTAGELTAVAEHQVGAELLGQGQDRAVGAGDLGAAGETDELGPLVDLAVRAEQGGVHVLAELAHLLHGRDEVGQDGLDAGTGVGVHLGEMRGEGHDDLVARRGQRPYEGQDGAGVALGAGDGGENAHERGEPFGVSGRACVAPGRPCGR